MIIIYKGERVIFPPATIMQYINMSCYYLLSKSIDRGIHHILHQFTTIILPKPVRGLIATPTNMKTSNYESN